MTSFNLQECRLCGKRFGIITQRHLDLRHPGWTIKQYKERFGESSVYSDDWYFVLVQKEFENRNPAELSEEQKQVALASLLSSGAHLVGARLALRAPLFSLPYLAWKGRVFQNLGARLSLDHGFSSRLFRPHFYCTVVVDYPLFNGFLTEPGDLDELGLAVLIQDAGVVISPRTLKVSLSPPTSHIVSLKLSEMGLNVQFLGNNMYLDREEVATRFGNLIHPSNRHLLYSSDLPTVQLTKRFEFDYGHFLGDYRGKCGFVHGHRGVAEITLEGPVDPSTGFVMDFGDLKETVESVLDSFDHHLVNLVDSSLSLHATAEMMAMYLAVMLKPLLPYLKSVKVYETPSSFVLFDVKELPRAVEFLEKQAEIGEFVLEALRCIGGDQETCS